MNESAVSREVLDALLAGEDFLKPYGPEVASVGTGCCEILIPYRRSFDRPGGVVNGIVIMAAADVAMWCAIMTLRGLSESWVTSQLNTAFLHPAREEAIACTATVLRLGRRTCYGSAECRGVASGRLVAHYTVAYARVTAP
ncbi:MAG: PaaI family thioesterase [Gammaproteobacteria bacterium]|nr:PaaI family thioesterase [Gammaproteobacteria bacterium]MBI5618630.1 PaaI family thioesterase [Gammaproteobacteria bacterium]